MTEQELKMSMYRWTRKNKICSRVFGRLKNTGKRIITREELEQIWYRDGADNMNKPRIKLINRDGDYTVYNCKFYETYEKNYSENFRYNEKEDYKNEWD